MALFRRRRAALEYDLLRQAPVQSAQPAAPSAAPPRPGQWIAPRSGEYDAPFRVSGTQYRQEALAVVGSGTRLFRLMRQPDNPHDPFAVQVLCEGVHIGYISAKNSSRYTEVIAEREARGSQVFVHGQVRKQGNQHATRWVALIDCAYPDEF